MRSEEQGVRSENEGARMTSELWSIYQGGRPVADIAASRVEARPLTSAMYSMVATEEKKKADGIQVSLRK